MLNFCKKRPTYAYGGKKNHLEACTHGMQEKMVSKLYLYQSFFYMFFFKHNFISILGAAFVKKLSIC